MFLAGSSGYSYKYWGSRVSKNLGKENKVLNFYPLDCKSSKWLKYYSERFNSIEINCTRYKKLTRSVCEKWKIQVDKNFKFVIKVDYYLTHKKKLNNIEEWWENMKECIDALQENFYCLLFQFPPMFKRTIKNLEKLEKLQKIVAVKCAFEFRDIDWFDDKESKEYEFQKKLFQVSRWTVVTVHIPPIDINGLNFGNLSKDVNTIYSFRNNKYKKFVYHRFHGTIKYSSGLYGYEYLQDLLEKEQERRSKLLPDTKFDICFFFNNVDTYNRIGEKESIPFGFDIVNIEIIPSALQDCKYLQKLFDN